MVSRRTVERKPRASNGFIADREIASELVTLARTARLERLSLLLDFVRREAGAEAESSAA